MGVTIGGDISLFNGLYQRTDHRMCVVEVPYGFEIAKRDRDLTGRDPMPLFNTCCIDDIKPFFSLFAEPVRFWNGRPRRRHIAIQLLACLSVIQSVAEYANVFVDGGQTYPRLRAGRKTAMVSPR